MSSRVLSVGLLYGVLTASAALAAAPTTDYSNPSQVEPYIESLRQKGEIPPAPAPPPPLPPTTTNQQAPDKLNTPSNSPQDVQPYIESLRQKEGLGSSASKSAPSPQNPDAEQVQPYLETVKKGEELPSKMKGTVNQSVGVSVGTSSTFNVSSTKVQANPFDEVYSPDSKWAPSADLSYEYQLFRNTNIGAVGLVSHLNIITISGHGIFTQTGAQSPLTTMKFYAMPFSVGGSYRFLKLRYIDPFMQFSAVGIPYIETRNDGFASRRGISRGYNVTPGVAINLDWISRKDAWAQYDTAGILHTYLIAQYEILRTIAGPVTFNYNGLYIGLMFEF